MEQHGIFPISATYSPYSSFTFLFCIFALIDVKVWYDFFTYDINAQDLTIDGRLARNKYVLSYYDVRILFGELYSYELIVLPMTLLPSLYYYNKFR